MYHNQINKINTYKFIKNLNKKAIILLFVQTKREHEMKQIKTQCPSFMFIKIYRYKYINIYILV